MDEVTPWVSDYFLNLATSYGSDYKTFPATKKAKKCQLKKVLTVEPKDYVWVVLSDKKHEVPGRIPKEVVEQCVKEANRDKKFTRHVGSLIEIRDFSPLFIRVEDGPSTSAPRKVLALEIRRARLRGASGEAIWGTPQQLDSIQDLKQWLHELRKPDGNQDVLKIRKKQQDEAKATKQFGEPSESLPDPELRPQLTTNAPAAAQRKAPSTTSAAVERQPMQRYRRRWKKAVPGLDEFARRIQMPEGVQLKILEKQTEKEAKAKSRSLGAVPTNTNRPPKMRGALEIGSSPARLGSVPRATTPEEWPTSPGILGRLYNDRETEMSSDVESSRLSTPADVYHDVEMGEAEPQPESETVPETPQVLPDSQPQHPSPPPPAQPPRPRSPLPSSSNPQMQNQVISPSSVHTSVQAISGSQLPSSEKPLAWAGLDDEPSNGPSFELPWTQRDDSRAVVPHATTGPNPPLEKQVTERSSPVKEIQPAAPKLPQEKEKETATRKTPRGLAFGESITEAIEKAFQQGDQKEAAPTTNDPATASSVPKVTVAQLPPPKPRSKPPSKAMQKPLPGPSSLDRPTEAELLGSPVRQPFQALNRKVPAPEVDLARELSRARNNNGAPTMVLVPASDDTKASSPSKHSSSQHVQSSQSLPSSLPVPSSTLPPPPQNVPSSEPQIQDSEVQFDISIAQEGDPVAVQVNDTVVDVEVVQDLTKDTQSSLEYASTQEEDKVAVVVEPQKSTDKPAEVVITTEKVADEHPSPLPQIVAIREVESQRSPGEEIDELEGDSDAGDHPPVTKRKSKTTPKRPFKVTKNPRLNGPAKSNPPSNSPKPHSRPDPAVEEAPSRSKLPPKPTVVIERRRTPVAPTDEPMPTAQKRRPTSPSEEGFPVPQPAKRSRINGHRRPAQTTLPPPRTPSPVRKQSHSSVVSSVSQSAKGKGRAEGIKGLENIDASGDVGNKLGAAQVQSKKRGPDTGSKRKPSDAFSARDDSRDVKRPKVAKEPEPRKLEKQLSFVDPDKLRRPFRSKPQVPKTSAQRGATTTAIVESSAVAQVEKEGPTSKYFNPQLYKEPGFPRMTATPEVESPQKVAKYKETAHETGRDSGDTRRRVGPRKPTTSAAQAHVQHSVPVEDVETDLVGTQPQYPPARKLGSFAPDLNPPPLPGLPGGRLMNKQLREILIRTGRIRTKEVKAAESRQNGR